MEIIISGSLKAKDPLLRVGRFKPDQSRFQTNATLPDLAEGPEPVRKRAGVSVGHRKASIHQVGRRMLRPRLPTKSQAASRRAESMALPTILRPTTITLASQVGLSGANQRIEIEGRKLYAHQRTRLFRSS